MPQRAWPYQYVGITAYGDSVKVDDTYSRVDVLDQETTLPSIWLYTSPGTDRVPVYRYFNRDFGDAFLTTSWSELAYGFASWDYLGIVGYAYEQPRPGNVRLYRWFNDRTGKHAFVTVQDPLSLSSADGWAMEGQTLYVPESPSEGKLQVSYRACAAPDCACRAFGPASGYCLDHTELSTRKALISSVAKLDHASRTVNLSGISIKSTDWQSILEWIMETIPDPAGWLIDLSGALVEGSIKLKAPPGVTLDLSACHVAGSLELRDAEFSRLILSGIRVDGSILVRDTLIRDGIFADHMQLSQTLRVDRVVAAETNTYLDGTSTNRVEISNSDFAVLSFANCIIGIRSAIEGTEVGTLICTQLISMQDWALRRCSVAGYSGFCRASIASHLNLEFNSFGGLVDLSNLSCGEAVHLADSRYLGDVVLNGVGAKSLDMHNSSFQGRVTAVESNVSEVLDLRSSKMLEPVLLTSDSHVAVLDDTVFYREATVQLAGTVVSAVRTRFESSSRIGKRDKFVKILDLTNTDLSGVQLDEVDLTFCIFAQALNLERMRFVGAASFATVPRHFQQTPWYRWRAARKVVWEEVVLRGAQDNPGWSEWRDRLSRGVADQAKSDFEWGLPTPQLAAKAEITYRKLSSIYRDLRRSQEGSDEESEANEFYYSEMTLRRQNSRGWRRGIFILYWILGGYGVRPSRPLISFAVAAWSIAVGLVQFQLLASSSPAQVGRFGYTDAFNYLLHTSISVLGTSEFQPRGFSGLFLDLLARLLLPTLLALMFLGIRANVKRGH
jgi:uncharacterized protein YjbI with pentapeptide repeats